MPPSVVLTVIKSVTIGQVGVEVLLSFTETPLKYLKLKKVSFLLTTYILNTYVWRKKKN